MKPGSKVKLPAGFDPAYKASFVKKSDADDTLQDGIRLLAKGELKTKITIEVAGASQAAIAAVEKAGGKVVLPEGVAPPAAPTEEAESPKPRAARRKASEAEPEAATAETPNPTAGGAKAPDSEPETPSS